MGVSRQAEIDPELGGAVERIGIVAEQMLTRFRSTIPSMFPRRRFTGGDGPKRRGLWKSTPIRLKDSLRSAMGTLAPRRIRTPVCRNNSVIESSTPAQASWLPRLP